MEKKNNKANWDSSSSTEKQSQTRLVVTLKEGKGRKLGNNEQNCMDLLTPLLNAKYNDVQWHVHWSIIYNKKDCKESKGLSLEGNEGGGLLNKLWHPQAKNNYKKMTLHIGQSPGHGKRRSNIQCHRYSRLILWEKNRIWHSIHTCL